MGAPVTMCNTCAFADLHILAHTHTRICTHPSIFPPSPPPNENTCTLSCLAACPQVMGGISEPHTRARQSPSTCPPMLQDKVQSGMAEIDCLDQSALPLREMYRGKSKHAEKSAEGREEEEEESLPSLALSTTGYYGLPSLHSCMDPPRVRSMSLDNKVGSVASLAKDWAHK